MNSINDHSLICLLNSNKMFKDDKRAISWLAAINKAKAERLLDCIGFLNKPIVALKWMLTVHTLMLEEFRGNEWFGNRFLRLEFSDTLQKSLNKIQATDVEGQKIKNILACYSQYIKRKILTQNYFLWGYDVNRDQCTTQKLSDCFSLINIMKTATSVRHQLFFFGRYFKQKYGLVEDLNILLGKDLNQLYGILKNIIESLERQFNGFSLEEQNIVQLILDQIQLLNQELNVIYYNTYYYKSVKIYQPQWIKLEKQDIMTPHSRRFKKQSSQKDSDAVDKILTLRKRILSCDETCSSPFQDSLEDPSCGEESICPMLTGNISKGILCQILEHFNDGQN